MKGVSEFILYFFDAPFIVKTVKKMKKYAKSILLAGCLSFLFIACSDEGGDNKAGVVNWQEVGKTVMEFSYQDSDVKRTFTLYNNDAAACTVQLRPYTQKELDEYNRQFGKNYSLMPESAYELNTTSVSFGSGELTKEVEVCVHPAKLFDVIRKDTEAKQYVITLKAGDSSVADNRDLMCLVDMAYPVIRMEKGARVRLMGNMEKELDLIASSYEDDLLISNKGNIDLDIKVLDASETWLKNYNKEYDADYKLLPEGAFTLSKLIGIEGEKSATATIKVSSSLTSGGQLEYGDYVLPLQLSGEDDYMALDHDVSVVKVSAYNSYSDTNREYDDGENIIFHVKLAIDEEGFAMMDNDMEFFKEYLGDQWDEINRRFNGLDKKGILNRNYIFVPDLEDIIVYKYKSNDSHWSVAKDYEDRIDVSKFQLSVAYDFVKQDGEGGGGFGGNCPEGMNNIMVTCYSKTKEDVRKYAGTEALSDESIVHELGHYRGLIDTYWCEISAANNKVNGKSFTPERGNMMGACYAPIEEVEWSEYEMYVINTTAAGGKNVDIHSTVRDYFPDEAEFQVTENGKPVKGFTLNFYPKDYTGSNIEKVSRTYTQEGNSIILDAKVPLFWPWQVWYENHPHTYNRLLLVEAISTQTGKKAYQFLPVYEVHKQGLLDKYLNKITGKSVFKMTIDIK